MSRRLVPLLLGLLRLLAPRAAAGGSAADPSAPACARPGGAAVVVRCALAASPEVRGARQELAVLGGRRLAAGTWLPSHPVLAVSAAERRPFAPGRADVGPTFNWYLALSQEIELGGQRGLRLDVADAEAAVGVRRLAAAEGEAAAAALAAYYDLLAAREERDLADEVGRVAAALAGLGAARAREALISPVDADVAQAEAVRAALGGPEAARRSEGARALLGALFGLPQVDADGSLDRPVPAPAAAPEALLERALAVRGDLAAVAMEQRAALGRARLLRRERLPNVTLSFLAQSDGFDERVLGAALALPLRLPGPLWPGRAGEIAAADARAAQAEAGAEGARRRVRLEVERALAAERAATAALGLFPAELCGRARADLRALGTGLSARQLSVREALLMQRSLIELLQAHVRARLGHALARIELLRAAGLLPGGVP